jgi:fructose-1-phosphate kinase PfkB-like protein
MDRAGGICSFISSLVVSGSIPSSVVKMLCQAVINRANS